MENTEVTIAIIMAVFGMLFVILGVFWDKTPVVKEWAKGYMLAYAAALGCLGTLIWALVTAHNRYSSTKTV